MAQKIMTHSVESATLADILERILDKGIVIAGDIKVKLCDIELLTIQIRLMIASVDKAREMGMDWWTRNPDFNTAAGEQRDREVRAVRRRGAEPGRQRGRRARPTAPNVSTP